MKRILQTLVLVTFLLLLLTTLATAQAEKTIVTSLDEDGRFTTLLAAIEITKTEQAFSEGHWTLFAPTDEAFAKMGVTAENIGSLLSLGPTADLLLYHAMDEEVTSDEAKLMLGDVTMSNGWIAGLKWYDDSLWVNDLSRVTEPDKFASNGVIHVVDHVVTPPWPRTADTENALKAAIEEAKLLQVEEGIEEEEDVAEAKTTETDESKAAATEEEVSEEPVEETVDEVAEVAVTIPEGSVLDVMVKDGRFATYLEAIGALDLVSPYTEGEWTIFAPTDEAFAAEGLNADNITSEYSVGELADLLLYHALDEEVSVDKAKTMLGDVTMRNGQVAGLKFFDDLLWVNDHSRVIGPDIRATNGIIHAIDQIIERPWPLVEVVDLTEPETEQSGDTQE